MGEEFKDFEASTPTLTLEPDISTPPLLPLLSLRLLNP